MEAFFEKFEVLAETPGGVGKLRDLVLELAVGGKLLADSNFHDWVSVELGDIIVRSLSSVTPADSPHTLFELWSVPSFASGEPEIRSGSEIGSTKRTLLDGTILLGKINPHLNRVWTVSRRTQHPLIASPEWITISPGTTWDTNYLARVLTSPRFNRELCSTAQGMGSLTRANTKMASAIEIRCPPLAEQRRIAAMVDELMALCDQLEAQQREREERKTILVRAALGRFGEAPTPANLQLVFHRSYDVAPAELRKAILTLAVKGKLVAQDAAGVGAISVDGAHFTRPRSSESREGAPFELPTGWQWIRLGQVGELINGDRSKNYPRKEEYVQEGVPWINTGHIKPDGTLSIDDLDHISREKFDSLRSGKVRRGDLVYCLRGTLGKTAIITQIEEGAVASSLVIIRPAPHVDSRFAYCYLASPLGRSYIYQFDNGSAQPNLSARNVKKYWVPLPPLAEQRRIVAKVDELMALVDALEAQLATARTKGSALLDAVLAELTAA